MKKKILSLTIAILFILSIGQAAFAGDVTISDTNFRSALYNILGIPASQPLTTTLLASITGDVNLSNKSISDISGIEYLTGATSIDLSLNKIGSIPREIENLTSLKGLDISGNRITRLPSNLGNMTGLRVLDIRANRLDELTSALSKLTLDEFYCDYNFFDLTEGSGDLNIINSINATVKEYTHQLAPLSGCSAYSPENGTIVIYWDKAENILFDNSTVGKVDRIVILDENYGYIGETSPANRTYEITGLNTTDEYKFYISADYYVLLTKYDDVYTKIYQTVVAKAVPQNTPEPNISPTPTPTVEMTPTPTITPEPETATPTVEITPTPVQATATPVPTDTPQKTSLGLRILYFVIALLVIAFVFVTLTIIIRAVTVRNDRNNGYRR